MNAKEEVLKELKARKYELEKELSSMVLAGFSNNSMEYKIVYSSLYRINDLITAVENAIFDVPSEEEMDKIIKDYIIELIDCKSIKKHEQSFIYAICFQAINYILNYKKPESDDTRRT